MRVVFELDANNNVTIVDSDYTDSWVTVKENGNIKRFEISIADEQEDDE